MKPARAVRYRQAMPQPVEVFEGPRTANEPATRNDLAAGCDPQTGLAQISPLCVLPPTQHRAVAPAQNEAAPRAGRPPPFIAQRY